VTIVRIVLADPRTGQVPDGSAVNGRHLIVLADTVPAEDGGQRAVPLWLPGLDFKLLWWLLDAVSAPGTARDAVMAGVLEETAARLLDTAGVAVTAVDIEPASEDVPELRSDTAGARVGLVTAAGTRQVMVSAGYGLKLAVAAGAPVRVADAVMDRLAVPVQGEDMHAPFLLPSAVRPPGDPGPRQSFEPRNMAFTAGLDRWELAGSFLDAGRPHWQDYSCAAADGTAVLAAAVPEPSGSAVLFQEICADDYRGAAVIFRGQLRTAGVAGQAGLHLAAGRSVDPPGEHQRDRGGSSLTGLGSSDWTWHNVTMPVPGDAGVIRFGVSLAGRGRIELRDAELSPARPETAE
jgi:hypothetical protein